MFNDNQAICKISTSVRQNEKIRLIKYAVFCDSVRYEDCRTQAAEEMEKALSVSLETLYEKQEEYLADYWERCFVEIEDGEELDTALQYNLYQLIQSVGKDPYSSIAPKGLSGEGYEGHYFWDSEMYIQPYFTITNPSFSKKLIEYRYTTLQYARENAARLGHARGARYPWRTIMGKECSGYFPAGSAQYHINGDIAYSIIAYYLATKDLPFILEKGAEVLFETARLWLDVGNFHEGKFLINGVTGPDEYTCMVNNNYYTNVLAQYHLRWAVKFYGLLRSDPAFSRLRKRSAGGKRD
jgi:alpha,alpha-trehalose phosphorylase